MFRPAFKKFVVQNDPMIIMWQPRNKRDVIFEIQDKDYRWSDKMVNSLVGLAEDLTLESENPEIPQILLGGNPFNAMQTSMAFGGTSEESKLVFVGAFMEFLKDGKAVVLREENMPPVKGAPKKKK